MSEESLKIENVTWTVEILLTKEAILEAREIGGHSNLYTGPKFESAEQALSSGGMYRVYNTDGTRYSFPISRIARVKITQNV